MLRGGRCDELAAVLSAGTPREVRSRLVAMLLVADEPFFFVDLASGTMTWSQAIELALGHRRSAIGRSIAAWAELVHPEDRDRVARRVAPVLDSSADVAVEDIRVTRADGSYVRAHARACILRKGGVPVSVLGALLLEGARGEAAGLPGSLDPLELEQRSRELVLRAVSDVVYEWEPTDTMVVRGPALRDLFGYEPTDLAGGIDWWLERVHPADRPGVAADFDAFMQGCNAQWAARYRFRRADGEYVEVRDRAYAIRSASGTVARIIGAMSIAAADPEDRPTVRVTARQLEVLDLVRSGATSKEIALRLEIGEQSAKQQVSRLLRRFGVANRAALVTAVAAVRLAIDRPPESA